MTDYPIVRIEDYYKEITEQYLKNIAVQAMEISELLEKRHFEEILKQTHQMKGSGSSFGFHVISEIATQIDQAAEDRNSSPIPSLLQNLQDYLDHVRVEYVPEDEL